MRIKAFTIIEMIVSLMISGIVIGIIYYGFELFKKQFNQYNKRTESNRSFVLLKRALNQDFESSEVLIGSNRHVIFYSDGMTTKRAFYDLHNDFMVRNGPLENDTFHLQCRIHLIKYSPIVLNAVREITFQIKLDDEYIDCVFNKNYSARDLMDCQKNHYEQPD
jgi:prepilin-type N-terminal cleavage/methylation domain-containing protein